MSMPVNKIEKKKKGKSDLGIAIIFLAPSLIGFMIFTLVPMVFSMVMSLYDWPLTGEHTFVGLDNFITLFTQDVLFWKVMKNTLVYVAAYVALNVVIAMAMAVWITSLKKANEFFRSAFFLPMMIGIVSSTMIFKWILSENGLVNTIIRLFGGDALNWFGSTATAMIAVVIVSVWQGFGYNMVIFISGLLGVPDSVKEAAKIDGANAVQTFFRVILPCMSPSVFFAVVMTVISSFQVFDQTYVSTMGGPNNATNTLVLYLYNYAFKYQRLGYASAIAWILFFCILIVTALLMKQQKRFVNYEG
ncbi:MAG: sugar ABC transporter permease [Dorea sp.]|jgi:multiple sugar transport system permease protein|nr:sugar ABC transporter permease [Dorea sp.]